MKTKQAIYFALILLGAVLLASGGRFIQKEYAFAAGMVLLMFGIYKTSQGYGGRGNQEEDQ